MFILCINQPLFIVQGIATGNTASLWQQQWLILRGTSWGTRTAWSAVVCLETPDSCLAPILSVDTAFSPSWQTGRRPSVLSAAIASLMLDRGGWGARGGRWWWMPYPGTGPQRLWCRLSCCWVMDMRATGARVQAPPSSAWPAGTGCVHHAETFTATWQQHNITGWKQWTTWCLSSWLRISPLSVGTMRTNLQSSSVWPTGPQSASCVPHPQGTGHVQQQCPWKTGQMSCEESWHKYAPDWAPLMQEWTDRSGSLTGSCRRPIGKAIEFYTASVQTLTTWGMCWMLVNSVLIKRPWMRWPGLLTECRWLGTQWLHGEKVWALTESH